MEEYEMADETMPNQPNVGSEPSATTAEPDHAAPSAAADGDAPHATPVAGQAEAIDDDDVEDMTEEDDEEDDDEEDDDEEDEAAVDEVIAMEDETTDGAQTSDDAGTVTLRLSTDLRRRLRRRADREGVAPEELAEELLGAAIRRPAAESLTDVLARVEKLERTVAELGTARARPDAPATPPRRPEERPRGDFGSRAPGAPGSFGERNYDRGPSERPSYGDRDRGGYAGPRRPEERPRFSDRPSSGGFGRPEGRFGDRPRYDAPDRGPARPSFDRRNDRDESRDRPARRWESPRRGE
jgi:hypothetical protein